MDGITASEVALEEIDLLPKDVRDFVFDREGCDFAMGASAGSVATGAGGLGASCRASKLDIQQGIGRMDSDILQIPPPSKKEQRATRRKER